MNSKIIIYTIMLLSFILVSIYASNLLQTSQLANLFLSILIGTVFVLQYKYGSIVIKSIFTFMFVLYLTSIYTIIVEDMFSYTIQPFFLTLSVITAFLALYNNSYAFRLRSKFLWTNILIIFLIYIKLTILFYFESYVVSEIIGINSSVIFMAVWYYWMKYSKKTKLCKPVKIKEEIKGNYKFLHIMTKLDTEKCIWVGENINEENAYPYIFTEIMKAREEKLTLVLISASNIENHLFKSIFWNKKELDYIYIETENDLYIEKTIKEYEENFQ